MLASSALIITALLYYAALCTARPFATCRKCTGAGQRTTWRGDKACRSCRGKGTRLRTGRRMHNRLIELHRRDAS